MSHPFSGLECHRNTDEADMTLVRGTQEKVHEKGEIGGNY